MGHMHFVKTVIQWITDIYFLCSIGTKCVCVFKRFPERASSCFLVGSLIERLALQSICIWLNFVLYLLIQTNSLFSILPTKRGWGEEIEKNIETDWWNFPIYGLPPFLFFCVLPWNDTALIYKFVNSVFEKWESNCADMGRITSDAIW